MQDLEDRTLGWLVAAATLIFGWILWPFSGAILWATLLATMFAPLFNRLLRAMPGWHNSAALLTLLVIIVMVILPLLYLLFFLLRDGRELSARIRNAIPLPADQKQAVFDRFTVAVQAIVKGSFVVALVQGALGGLILWFLGIRLAALWGALMAVLSLLPVFGTALVWGPIAAYLLMTGALWQGLLLIVYGVLVIGLVDNLLRPILIGQETQIPDYVVLVSTLGGIATFGANGLVIGPMIAAIFLAVWSAFSVSRQASPDDGVRR